MRIFSIKNFFSNVLTNFKEKYLSRFFQIFNNSKKLIFFKTTKLLENINFFLSTLRFVNLFEKWGLESNGTFEKMDIRNFLRKKILTFSFLDFYSFFRVLCCPDEFRKK